MKIRKSLLIYNELITLQGEPGIPGRDGEPGPPGPTAYIPSLPDKQYLRPVSVNLIFF